MTSLALTHDQDPETAETAVFRALAAHPDRTLTVRLNGFSADDWHVIAGRLPKRYAVRSLGPNVRVVYAPTTHAGTLDVSILSGRFDAAGAKVADAWAAERQAGADVLLGTELRHRVDSTLLGADHRYALLHGAGAKGETAVEYNRDRFREVAHRFVEVWGGGGQGRFAHKAYALAVVLEDRTTGHRFVVVQNHNKAHLFKGSRFYDPRNLQVWLVGMRRQAAAVAELRREYNTDAELVTGDFNAGGPWLARQMARFFPGFKPANSYRFGQAWVRGLRPVSAHGVNVHGASDHAGQRVRFAL